MKYLGKGKVMTDSFLHIEKGAIVDVQQYEKGEEIYSTGRMVEEDEDVFRILHGANNTVDECSDSEFELLGEIE